MSEGIKANKRDLLGVLKGMSQTIAEYEASISQSIECIRQYDVSRMDFAPYIKILEQQIKTAGNKFTIAMIGEFKAGKSTIVNTILNLKGNEQLSCKVQPDTAKSIRVMKKREEQDYEAEIIYEPGTYPNEKLSWNKAKEYTSQVALEDSPELQKKARFINEVRYYVDNDILDSINFLDLPGTGYDLSHDKVTEEKIQECDAVFWVLSTGEEPGKKAIENLKMIKHKIVPVINVWYDEVEQAETGDLTFDEVVSFLNNNCKSYLGDNAPVYYNAKAIEYALKNEEEPDDKWGYQKLREYLLELINAEQVDLEREKKERILDNVLQGIAAMQTKSEKLHQQINKIEMQQSDDTMTNNLLNRKLSRAYNIGQENLSKLSRDKVQDIIQKMNESAELFIDDKMSSISIKIILKSLGKKRKEALEKELKKEFIEDYLELEDYSEREDHLELKDQDNWLTAVMSEFNDDARTVLEGEYIGVGLEISEEMEQFKKINITANFISSIIENTLIATRKACFDMIPTIFGTLLLCLPGFYILDLLVMLGASLLSQKHNRLSERIEKTKRRARLSIAMQRHTMEQTFRQAGNKINLSIKSSISGKLEEQKGKINHVRNCLDNIMGINKSFEEFMIDISSEINSFR